MRIATNTIQDNVVRQIQQLGVQSSKLQTQVATGQRILQADGLKMVYSAGRS